MSAHAAPPSSALSIALERLAATGSRTPLPIVSGGTDFYPALGDAPPPSDILDLHGIEALSGIRTIGDTIEIGAGTTWRALMQAPLPPAFDALKQAAGEVGSVQIQSRGTLGGNVCTASPAADGMPPLLALDARVRLVSVRGTRELSLSDYVLGPRLTARAPDELLVAVIVPMPSVGTVAAFHKLGARRYLVISIAMLACNLRIDGERVVDVRLAVGACSPVALRLTLLERALEGVPPDGVEAAIRSSLADGALDALQPIDDVRASARYRRDAVAGAIERLVPRAVERAAESPRSGDAMVGARSHGR